MITQKYLHIQSDYLTILIYLLISSHSNSIIISIQDKDHAEQDQLDTAGTANKNIVVDMSMGSSVLIKQ